VIEKKDVHIAVGGKASLYYLPLTIAEQLVTSRRKFEPDDQRLCGGSQR